MLVAVLMVFVIFSFTGVAVLNVSYLSSSTSMETSQNIKLQYEMESKINEALWRINTGVDSLANFCADGATVNWDPQLSILSVEVDNFNMESEVLLDLSEDTHFDHALASSNEIITNGYTVASEEGSRKFNFLPDADLQYLMDNAVQVHTGNFKNYKNGDFSAPGIHIVEGNFNSLENVTINGTLVITGALVFFDKKLTVNADTSTGLPAIVFTNEDNTSWFTHNSPADDIEVNGAVYSAGKIFIGDGDFTGPIIGKVIELQSDMDFGSYGHKKYHRWNQGFGNKDNYDWPKHIGRWKTSKWAKKHNQA